MRQFLIIVLLTMATSVFAHGGEDHGAPPPVVSQAMAPRAIAATDEFEVVAILEEKKLVLYVDRFTSNEPVTNAKVEVEGAGLKGLASESAPGIYVMDVATPLPSAKHPLTIAIETDDSADLLSASLDTTLLQTEEPHVHGWSEWVVWIVAAFLLLLAAALLAARRKKNARGS